MAHVRVDLRPIQSQRVLDAELKGQVLLAPLFSNEGITKVHNDEGNEHTANSTPLTGDVTDLPRRDVTVRQLPFAT